MGDQMQGMSFVVPPTTFAARRTSRSLTDRREILSSEDLRCGVPRLTDFGFIPDIVLSFRGSSWPSNT